MGPDMTLPPTPEPEPAPPLAPVPAPENATESDANALGWRKSGLEEVPNVNVPNGGESSQTTRRPELPIR